MAGFKGVVGVFLRKTCKNVIFKRSSGFLSYRSAARSGQITAVQGQVRTNSTGKDHINDNEPIAYSKSPAQQHKVNDTLEYESKRLSSIRTFIICFGLMSFITYYGFIREETEVEQKLFDLNENQENLAGLQSKQENVTESEVLKKREI